MFWLAYALGFLAGAAFVNLTYLTARLLRD